MRRAPAPQSQIPQDDPSRVEDIEFADELESSFLEYSLAVIVSRAIPDARDGLKPVQRRLLYAMWRAGLTPDKPHRKAVAAVSETMKSYHPHGDASIYDTLCRLVQPFNTRLPLVDGHGNFGGLDDPAAAARYTEARLSAAALGLLAEVDEDTVAHRDNFDATTTEPVVLPAAFPALLVNGTSGIAVGMTTNIPPHNLGEVIAATVAYLRNDSISNDELLTLVPGPDFPSGGMLIGTDAIAEAYRTAKGSLRLRARGELETLGRQRSWVFTELPYLVGPERVVARVRDLLAAGRLDGVASIDDHSDRHNGLRLVVTLTPTADADAVAAELYRLTPLEESVTVNLVAIVGSVPVSCTLRDLIAAFADHRLEVVASRCRYRQGRAERRLNIVDALLLAIDHLDEVIDIARHSRSAEQARIKIAKLLGIDDDAASAVLDLSLRRLGSLERSKLRTEQRDLRAVIKELKSVLASRPKLVAVVTAELEAFAAEHAQPRLTIITDDPSSASPAGTTSALPGALRAAAVRADGSVCIDDGSVPDAIAHVDLAAGDLVLVSSAGAIKRITPDAISERSLTRAGSAGVVGVRLDDGDAVAAAFTITDHDADIVIVSSTGRALRLSAAEVRPKGAAAGPMAGMRLSEAERVLAAGVVSPGAKVALCTNLGQAAAVDVADIPAKRRGGSGVAVLRLRAAESDFTSAAIGPDPLAYTERGSRIGPVPTVARGARSAELSKPAATIGN